MKVSLDDNPHDRSGIRSLPQEMNLFLIGGFDLQYFLEHDKRCIPVLHEEQTGDIL
jgi:hypothetical protein